MKRLVCLILTIVLLLVGPSQAVSAGGTRQRVSPMPHVSSPATNHSPRVRTPKQPANKEIVVRQASKVSQAWDSVVYQGAGGRGSIARGASGQRQLELSLKDHGRVTTGADARTNTRFGPRHFDAVLETAAGRRIAYEAKNARRLTYSTFTRRQMLKDVAARRTGVIQSAVWVVNRNAQISPQLLDALKRNNIEVKYY